MKIRNGFVSNSSSSSFLIYGVSAYDIDEKILREKSDVDDAANKNDALEIVANSLGLEVFGCYDVGYCMGLSWDSTKESETRAQFKHRVESAVNKLDPSLKCNTISRAWYNG